MGRISPCAARHDQILTMLDQGLSNVQIAARLGLPHSKVQSYLQYRKIRQVRTRPLKVDEGRMRSLLADGRTQQQVAEAIGVSLSAIERRVRHLGLETARTGPRSGPDHREWLGGRRLAKHGYIDVYAPMHPRSRLSTGTVPEHRLMMEVLVGRYLMPQEVVNHRDNHPRHNWPANLELFATNADHLRAELTGRAKATPRSSIPGAYGSNRTIRHCPDEHETLAQCPAGLRVRLAWYIESHRPTTEHRTLARRSLRQLGAWRDPFRMPSTE